MKKLVFFDTETTDFPLYNEPSDSPDQPHLVQLAAIVVDGDTRAVLSTIDLTIAPKGWVSSPEAEKIHGISFEKAVAIGVSEDLALSVFVSLIQGAKVIAYNTAFDKRIIRIAMKRYGCSEWQLNTWADSDNHYCAMVNSKELVGVLGANGKPKNAKLVEAYKHFTGKELDNAHTALADAEACMEVYWGIQDAMGATDSEDKINF